MLFRHDSGSGSVLLVYLLSASKNALARVIILMCVHRYFSLLINLPTSICNSLSNSISSGSSVNAFRLIVSKDVLSR